ncbi:2'-5' RNA ligase family protein [Rubrobacter aplysinae]|uniref:2'-5' RNA ligase family protein n=1 Tax=Rubrobacter aplysinae TaxID=909625 RepID=UPI00064C1AFB|nr:2'-5' RNA ligase family protein [Rubrobacter aplysinae]
MQGVKGYEEIWESFVSERTLEFGGHRDPEWQSGHELSASFVIPVDVSRFADRLQPMRDALENEPYVSLHPDHFMHITLLLLGFLTPEPEETNEVSSRRLTELGEHAKEALADFPPFSVELANLNAFPGAAFVEVHDGGGISRLQDTLCSGCGLKRPPGPPHLTLAYLQAPDGTPAPDSLVSAVSEYRDWPVGTLEVERAELTLLNVRDEYPEPRTLCELPLSGRREATGKA